MFEVFTKVSGKKSMNCKMLQPQNEDRINTHNEAALTKSCGKYQNVKSDTQTKWT